MGIQYPDVCPMQLDKDGGYYFRHVAAMTDESLHAKSDIAGQLGWRDREIDRLRAELAAKSKDADEYRKTLEIIAIGDSNNAMNDAMEALFSSGFWTDKEKGEGNGR